MKTTLKKAAELIGAHPRTLLRALTGKSNPTWSAETNPEVDTAELARVFGCAVERMDFVFKSMDELLRQEAAAKHLGIPTRTFRNRKYKPLIRHGGTVRWSRMSLDSYPPGSYRSRDVRDLHTLLS